VSNPSLFGCYMGCLLLFVEFVCGCIIILYLLFELESFGFIILNFQVGFC